VPQNSGIDSDSILIPIKDKPDKNVGANVILINHPIIQPNTKFKKGKNTSKRITPRVISNADR
jgi:hypothetical protein